MYYVYMWARRYDPVALLIYCRPSKWFETFRSRWNSPIGAYIIRSNIGISYYVSLSVFTTNAQNRYINSQSDSIIPTLPSNCRPIYNYYTLNIMIHLRSVVSYNYFRVGLMVRLYLAYYTLSLAGSHSARRLRNESNIISFVSFSSLP